MRMVVDQMINPERSRWDLSDGARRSRSLGDKIVLPRSNSGSIFKNKFGNTLRSATEILLPDELDPGGDGEEAERAQEADDPPDARQPQ